MKILDILLYHPYVQLFRNSQLHIPVPVQTTQGMKKTLAPLLPLRTATHTNLPITPNIQSKPQLLPPRQLHILHNRLIPHSDLTDHDTNMRITPKLETIQPTKRYMGRW